MIDVQTLQQGNTGTAHPVAALLAEGQSVWQDDISRAMLQDGSLRRRVDEVGIRGLTSNPTIFERAIAAGQAYDRDIERWLLQGKDAREIAEAVAVDDIRAAADLFRPVYDESSGGDGFVSIEVSPTAARDPEATLVEAQRLWAAVDRPNLFVKVPSTDQSVSVIEKLLSDGINVNITLLFSVADYERVALAYLAALEKRRSAGQPIDHVASVASIFVSRLDAHVDKLLDAKITESGDPIQQDRLRHLLGKAAVANARLAFARFRQIFAGPRWEALEEAGARVQRPLWASTATKNLAYRDVIYVEELVGPDTVTTVPRATLDAFLDHGVVRRTVDRDVDGAWRVIEEVASVGIDLDAVTDNLQEEGIATFNKSFDALLASIEAKGTSLSGWNRSEPPANTSVRSWDVAP